MKSITFGGIFGLLLVVATSSSTAQKSHDTSERTRSPVISLNYVCDEQKSIRLRLDNKTDWALGVLTDEPYYREKREISLRNGRRFSALPEDKNISLQYRVDKFARPDELVKAPTIGYQDSGSLSWIAPNSSIQFAVPKEYMTDELLVFVRFNYEWELPNHGTFSTSPEHRLSLRGIDLPDKRVVCGR